MKNFKRVLLFAVLTAIVGMCCFTLSSCNDNESKADPIAFITDKGTITDGAFNQDAYTGIKAYAEAHGIPYNHFGPNDETDASYRASIDLAIDKGSKVIVTAGYYFESIIYDYQIRYPDIKFVLLDGSPKDKDGGVVITSNTAAITFAEEQAGYLAGYAAAYGKYNDVHCTEFAFFGGDPLPSVKAFGYGFLQGIERAALVLSRENAGYPGQVHCKMIYSGDFEDNDVNFITAKDMYQNGTDIIFACGGALGKSVIRAAQEVNDEEASTRCKVVGVDSDQRSLSETVITSALKELGNAVKYVLKTIYEQDAFEQTYGGRVTVFNVDKGSVGLPVTVADDPIVNAFDRIPNFDLRKYNALISQLQTDSVTGDADIHVHRVLPNSDYIEESEDKIMTGLGLTKVRVSMPPMRTVAW